MAILSFVEQHDIQNYSNSKKHNNLVPKYRKQAYSINLYT